MLAGYNNDLEVCVPKLPNGCLLAVNTKGIKYSLLGMT